MTTRTIARREAIGRLALGSLGVAAAPVWLEALTARAIEHAEGWSTQRAAAATAWKPKALTAHQGETVATIAELIIPQTETAGARAARVHEFIDEVLHDAIRPRATSSSTASAGSISDRAAATAWTSSRRVPNSRLKS